MAPVRTAGAFLLIGLCIWIVGNRRAGHAQKHPNEGIETEKTPIEPIAISEKVRKSSNTFAIRRSASDLFKLLDDMGQHPVPRNETWDQYLNAIRELAKVDPKAALDLLAKLGVSDPVAAGASYVEVFRVVSQRDPQFLRVWLSETWPTLREGNVKDCCIWNAMSCLGKSAPSVGLEILASGKIPSAKMDIILESFFSSYATINPHEAIAAARNLDPQSRDLALKTLAACSACRSPEVALNIADQITDQALQIASKADAFSVWLSQSPDNALTAFEALDERAKTELLRISPLVEGSLLSKIAHRKPEILLEFIGSLEPNINNRGILESFVYFTVSEHTDETFRLIAAIPDSKMKSTMLDNAYRQLCETNLATAVEHLNQTDDDLQRNLALQSIGAKIGSMGMAQTLETIGYLPLEERKVFFEHAWRGLMVSDLPGLVSFVQNGIDSLQLSRAVREEILSHASGGIALQNKDEAIKWLNSVGNNDKAAVMKGISRTMANKDPEELEGFLDSMPRGEAWATGVKVLVRTIEVVDESKAKTWEKALDAYYSSKEISRTDRPEAR